MKSSHFTKGTTKNTGFSMKGFIQRGVSQGVHGVCGEITGNPDVHAFFRPKSGKYDSILKNRGKLLHKNTFLSPQAYREGLCFIHKVKMLRKGVRGSASPGKRNEKDSQTNFYSFANSTLEVKPRDSVMRLLEPQKKPRNQKNQSQQTLIIEEIPVMPRYQYNGIDHETLTPFRTYRKIQKPLENTYKTNAINITGWENELEYVKLN